VRKLALLFVLFTFFLLMGYTRAGQNIVSGDVENGEVRLEQNVGTSRPLSASCGYDKANFSVAYIVRAVTRGHYVSPPATVEDMHRPGRFGRTACIDVAAPK
jgi:uncharacterized protein YfaS (alpha-2-macroglobulin family)